MNENWTYLKNNIEKYPEYKSAIFERGFLFTNKKLEMPKIFPFYDNWKEYQLKEKYFFYIHKNQNAYFYSDDEATYFIIGHAYNPFEYEWKEENILQSLSKYSHGIFEIAIDYINDLTGLFVLGIIKDDTFKMCGDFESMYSAYYGIVEDRWYVSSHEELIAYYEKLTRDSYVEKLEAYKWYYLYGEGLPGDISHYLELKKVMCNSFVTYDGNKFISKRFYPNKPLDVCKNEEEYQAVVKEIADIMKKSLELTTKKWDRVALSITGGRDSKGSLAAATHLGDKIHYFSYNSQIAEKIDCDAANEICKSVGVKHTTYDIPLDKTIYPEYDIIKAILHVNSNRKKFNHNDIMKRIFFRKENLFDVEIKSWTSEIGRMQLHHKYGLKHLQKKCNGRIANVANNVYLFNPILMYETDAKYKKYLDDTKYNEHMFNYNWGDFFILEQRDSRWGADVITCEHMFAYDVSIPYNNRHLADLLQKPDLDKRYNSQTHIDFTNLLCPEIEKANISVKDFAHNNKRMWLDRIYYFISAIRPF